ncbi:hypothetical protein Q1695_009459 [Nippostrongylus brasiliensis]|nr:hypothetical protein Q1695_009459 [Nippostrongylus brasiliensis]
MLQHCEFTSTTIVLNDAKTCSDLYIAKSPARGAHNPAPSTTPPIYYNIEDIVNSDIDTMVDGTERETLDGSAPNKFGRRIALVRGAETMDEAFPGWFSSCVEKDQYTARDLNHPAKLPLRSKGLLHYKDDPPLTRLACYAAKILGEALAKDCSTKWDCVITAPELATVQTAFALANSTTSDKPFIDESFCEFSHTKTEFMTSMELQKMDVTATVVCKSKSKECEGSLARIEGEFEKIQVKNRGNLIIVVGPTAFDAILRKLLGSGRKKPRQQGIPHLACVLLERDATSWNLCKNQLLPFRTSNSARFNPLTYLSK